MRVAVIGAGRMGRRHIQIVRDLGHELAGVCDSDPKSLDTAREEQAVTPERCFNDAMTLLTKTRPECVIIATTAPSHCNLVCRAAEKGARFILCEKPMAVSLEECDLMIQTCRAHQARLAINHQMRFMQQYTEVRRLVNLESFGGLRSINVFAGNIGMAMNGTHYFEMFRYLTNEAPTEVTAWFSPEKVPNPRGPQFEDQGGSIHITTATGRRFYMEIGADLGHGAKVLYAGPYGQLLVDELAGTMSLSTREEAQRGLPTTRYATPSVEKSLKIRPADVLDPSKAVLQALLSDGSIPTGEDGRQAIAILITAYVSHENGHVPVPFEPAKLPRKRVFPWA